MDEGHCAKSSMGSCRVARGGRITSIITRSLSSITTATWTWTTATKHPGNCFLNAVKLIGRRSSTTTNTHTWASNRDRAKDPPKAAWTSPLHKLHKITWSEVYTRSITTRAWSSSKDKRPVSTTTSACGSTSSRSSSLLV